MALPLVTVVTPSFNQAQFLRETIESVLSQDYPHVEYMVMDGGSTDGSLEVIKQYAARLAYWVSEPDAGQADAINKGWRRAAGEVVAYLNSDDTYNPGAIRASVESLLAHPEAGMTYGECDWIDASSRRVGRLEARPFTLDELYLQNRIAQPSVFIRRTCLDRVGLLDPQLYALMDYELWQRIAFIYPTALVPGVIANFRIHAASKTGSQAERFLRENLRVIERAAANPAAPPSIRNLKSRAINYAYALACANAFALGQMQTGAALAGEWFEAGPDPLAFKDDIVEMFASHYVNVALLDYAPAAAKPGPEAWLAGVLAQLPLPARPLFKLEPRILARAHVMIAYQARARGDWQTVRSELFRAVALQPALVRQRGIASLSAQAWVTPLRRTPARVEVRA